MSENTERADFPRIRLWSRLPTIIRAIIVGFLVFAIAGSVAWTLVLTFVPPPWSVPVMIVILALYWMYFRGNGWPDSTRAIRRTRIRRTRLPAIVWAWSLFAALVAALLLQAILFFTFRVVEFPAAAWRLPYDFSALPTWQIWSVLVLAAFVAAITEEVGFRGYMQVPLEMRYGPTFAIGIVSFVFMLAHLNQAWAGGIVVVLIAISVIWGVLARVSDSLVPGIVSHGLADVVNFAYWWTDVAGSFRRRPVSETGIDAHFIVSGAAVLILSMLFVVAILQTSRLRRASDARA